MASTEPNPFSNRLQRGPLVLDGGLATALESAGCDLDDDLWSARILLEDPERIAVAHLDFLRAGADCIVTSSYQATPQKLRERGMGADRIREVLERSVSIAIEAREAWLQEQENVVEPPLVAASIGPYGAFLADGSEYRGDYGLGVDDLVAFHRERWECLAGTEADLLACETIPSLVEAEALLRLLEETPGRQAWLSFSCSDGSRLRDGSSFERAVDLCAKATGVAAVGVNCTAPEWVAPLIRVARGRTDLPIVVYPNSGETYDAGTRSWRPGEAGPDWSDLGAEWLREGASVIGGCCRTGPTEIARLRDCVTTHIEDSGHA